MTIISGIIKKRCSINQSFDSVLLDIRAKKQLNKTRNKKLFFSKLCEISDKFTTNC